MRTATMSDHQAIPDLDVLRKVSEVDLADCDPGTVVIILLDRDREVFLTTIIPGHHHGQKWVHGVSYVGPGFPRATSQHPKSTEVTRHLKVGEPLEVQRQATPVGKIRQLAVWSWKEHQPGS